MLPGTGPIQDFLASQYSSVYEYEVVVAHKTAVSPVNPVVLLEYDAVTRHAAPLGGDVTGVGRVEDSADEAC